MRIYYASLHRIWYTTLKITFTDVLTGDIVHEPIVIDWIYEKNT